MIQLDEETLMAYVDHQLSPERMAEVETALADDSDAQATVRMFRESTALLREAFDPILREPVPERLLATINAPPTGKVQDIRLARPSRTTTRFFPQTAWARAALVALFVGAGAGYLSGQWWRMPLEVTAPIAAIDPLLHEALETTASGAVFTKQEGEGGVERDILPLLSFRDAQQRYCREFESTLKKADGPQVSYGIACREEKSWQTQALMAGRLIAPTLGGEATSEHSQYAPAAGSEAAGFDAVIRQLMVDQPLTPEEEAALISRGWH